jgi:hypothetical protein
LSEKAGQRDDENRKSQRGTRKAQIVQFGANFERRRAQTQPIEPMINQGMMSGSMAPVASAPSAQSMSTLDEPIEETIVRTCCYLSG